jgi:glycosyltransferase involved in cell wall biosynthesis
MPKLSIVIPAYNEEKRLPESLEQVADFVERQDYETEVIIVNNNSRDRTAEVAGEFVAKFPFMRVMNEPTQGKGAAVQTGMLAAQGDYVIFCDADFSMPVDEIAKFLPPQIGDYDIAIGSREAPGAVRYNEPWHRHLMGRVFNWIVRLVAVRGFDDTQCGFKCFRSGVIADLFGHQTIPGWGFDVEVLFIAQKRGLKIVEVPIDWYYKPSSRVSPIKDSVKMFWEAFKVRLNDWKGLYS